MNRSIKTGVGTQVSVIAKLSTGKSNLDQLHACSLDIERQKLQMPSITAHEPSDISNYHCTAWDASFKRRRDIAPNLP